MPSARVTRFDRVWILNAAIAVGCAALLAGPVGDYDAIASTEVPWWLLAVVVAATERWPVHVSLGRNWRVSWHSFSLTDVPVTLVLLFYGGIAGVTAVVVGSAIALALRRLPAVKVVFNLGQFAFTTALAYVAVHAIAGPNPAFAPLLWFAVLLALQLGGLVTIALISAAMWISDG